MFAGRERLNLLKSLPPVTSVSWNASRRIRERREGRVAKEDRAWLPSDLTSKVRVSIQADRGGAGFALLPQQHGNNNGGNNGPNNVGARFRARFRAALQPFSVLRPFYERRAAFSYGGSATGILAVRKIERRRTRQEEGKDEKGKRLEQGATRVFTPSMSFDDLLEIVTADLSPTSGECEDAEESHLSLRRTRRCTYRN
ncbi:hypothetical protein PUN28_010614 [Cardiocondyla obscurior]|uniref:Uncharacterized protein n=1 Tax=Cardiocondyla obscurior TaxID=286306 RepID=A0AAW2FK36_9HYME